MSKEILDIPGEIARLNLMPYMHTEDAELILKKRMEKKAKAEKEAGKTPKAERTLTPAQRRKLHEKETGRSKDKLTELKRKHASIPERTQVRPLTIDSTNIHMANATGIRHFVEISTPESRRKDPTRIALSELNGVDVVNLLGKEHFRDFRVTVEDTHLTKSQLVLDVKEGKVDAGITTGTVPEKHLRNGVTAFSPLHFNRQGEIITPNNPVTIVARVPRGK